MKSQIMNFENSDFTVAEMMFLYAKNEEILEECLSKPSLRTNQEYYLLSELLSKTQRITLQDIHGTTWCLYPIWLSCHTGPFGEEEIRQEAQVLYESKWMNDYELMDIELNFVRGLHGAGGIYYSRYQLDAKTFLDHYYNYS